MLEAVALSGPQLPARRPRYFFNSDAHFLVLSSATASPVWGIERLVRPGHHLSCPPAECRAAPLTPSASVGFGRRSFHTSALGPPHTRKAPRPYKVRSGPGAQSRPPRLDTETALEIPMPDNRLTRLQFLRACPSCATTKEPVHLGFVAPKARWRGDCFRSWNTPFRCWFR